MINVIVFTKNNPENLSGLLKSIDRYWHLHPMINILMKSTTRSTLEQYKELEERYLMEPFCFRWQEKSFKEDVVEIIKVMGFDYTVFLSDFFRFERYLNIEKSIGGLRFGEDSNCGGFVGCPDPDWDEHPQNQYDFIYDTKYVLKKLSPAEFGSPGEMLMLL